MDGCRTPQRLARGAIGLVLAAFVASSSSAVASSPCPPIAYSVASAPSFCNVTFLQPTNGFPFDRLWWPAVWNGTPTLTTGAGFERASDHLDFVASSAALLSVQDNDGDRNLSAGDVLDVWSPGGCNHSVQSSGLTLYVGPNATSLVFLSFVTLGDGYATPPCGGTASDYVAPILVVVAAAAALAIPLTLIILLWRRVPRA